MNEANRSCNPDRIHADFLLGRRIPGPSDAKAQKTFAEAEQKLKDHKRAEPLDAFKKAHKQDGHHCGSCAEEIVTLAIAFGDYKLAIEAANELVSLSINQKKRTR